MISYYTHINWGGRYCICIGQDYITVEVLEWGTPPSSFYPPQETLWKQKEVMALDALIYFKPIQE